MTDLHETVDRALTRALRCTSLGIMVIDQQLRIVFANDAFLAASGRTLDDIVGHTPCILYPGKPGHALFRSIARALDSSGKWFGRFDAWGNQHAAHTGWMHIDTMRDARGHVHGYVAVLSERAGPAPERDELYRLAYHDPLTGLPNRQLFHDRTNQAIAQARRSRTGFAVFFIDLDGFKQVNDQLGHHAGDCLLIESARRMCGTIRESDTAARLAGDEFVMLLNNVHTQADAGRIAVKVVAALSLPYPSDGAGPRITASIGIARFPDDGMSMQELLGNADKAMYRAKKMGGGCYCFHGADRDNSTNGIRYSSPQWHAGRSGRSLP